MHAYELGSIWKVLPLLGVLALGGCGKELTAGGLQEGEVSAVATDEDAGASPAVVAPPLSLSRSPLGATEGPLPRQSALVQGTVHLSAAMALVSESGAVVPITDGGVSVDLPIGGTDPVQLGSELVAEGDYPTVRVTFTGISADVQGLVIGGLPFSGSVSVDLGGAPLVMDFPVRVQVRRENPSRLALRVHSRDWLAATQLAGALSGGSVSADAFRAAVRVELE